MRVAPMSEAVSKAVPCKGCGALIRFAKMESGRKMPVDAEPENLVVENDLKGVGEIRYCFRPHHPVCPKADDFRKKSAGET